MYPPFFLTHSFPDGLKPGRHPTTWKPVRERESGVGVYRVSRIKSIIFVNLFRPIHAILGFANGKHFRAQAGARASGHHWSCWSHWLQCCVSCCSVSS